MAAQAPDPQLTGALTAVSDGTPGAAARLMPIVYERLRSLAASHLAGERSGHTLQPTALVHEAFLRLVDPSRTFHDEAHFLASASQAMRRILVDHARGRGRQKRGGGAARVPLDDAIEAAPECELDLVELDDALTKLGAIDPEAARVVEMRFFAGMEEREVAGVLGVTERSVRRYWVHAKAWLARELLGVMPGPQGAST